MWLTNKKTFASYMYQNSTFSDTFIASHLNNIKSLIILLFHFVIVCFAILSSMLRSNNCSTIVALKYWFKCFFENSFLFLIQSWFKHEWMNFLYMAHTDFPQNKACLTAPCLHKYSQSQRQHTNHKIHLTLCNRLEKLHRIGPT